MFAFGDWVLADVEREVAAHPPERGGALLGPRLRPVVTRFVPDPAAAHTGATWAPSRALDAAVKALERDEGLELKGVVHSHPDGVDAPSEQDARELARGLALNGHMPCYLAPIVTRGPPRGVTGGLPRDDTRGPVADLAPHELALPSGKLSCFAGWRAPAADGAEGAEVRPFRPRVLPLRRDLERLAAALGATGLSLLDADVGAGLSPAGTLDLPGGAELLVVAGDQYPALAPALLFTQGGETAPLHLAWRLDVAEDERLERAAREVLRPPGPYRRTFGPRGGPSLTADPARAALAGWEPRLGGGDPDAAAGALREALLARGQGLLAPALRDRTVLVAGLGSVGSYVAEQLARSGVGGLALLDPEPVEAANLSRTAYAAEDVGRAKPDALARRLLAIAPALRLDLRASAVEDLAPAALDALVRGADLVVAATDEPAAQRALDRFAYARGRPALFVGLYAGADGGEVVVTVPGRTPCYLCATRARHAVEETAGRVERPADYGTGRLAAEPALGADVQHVASAAVKLALSLLLPGGKLGALAEGAVADGTPYLTLSTVPRYWFYPGIFRDVPGQGAYQAVWLAPVRREDCAVCGHPAGRLDPLEVPLRAPSREALAALLDDAPDAPRAPPPGPAACLGSGGGGAPEGGAMSLTVKSPAFAPGGEIPAVHTCEGQDVSPALEWSGVPAGAKSLALVVDDPDAPDPKAPRTTWVHWVLYDVPPTTTSLPEGARALPAGAREGVNDWKRTGYGGPCPPIGRHRYFFKLYALDRTLGDLGRPTRAALEKAMEGHVLARAELVGTYEKRR